LLAALTVAEPADAQTAPQTSGQSSDPRFLPQTNFRIDSDSFWNFFQQRGNVRTFGYPVLAASVHGD